MQRALKHLKGRFEFALSQRKPLYLNQRDVEALNSLIEIEQTKKPNKTLEDALMLFYILQHWKIENEQNKRLKMREDKQGVFLITSADVLLQKLSLCIHPKEMILKEIRDELRIHQAMNNIPKEERIKLADVRNLLEEVLETAKTKFPLFRDLEKIQIHYDTKDRPK